MSMCTNFFSQCQILSYNTMRSFLMLYLFTATLAHLDTAMIVQVDGDCLLSGLIPCDDIVCRNAINITADATANFACSNESTLSLSASYIQIQGNYSNLNLNGSFVVVLNLTIFGTLNITYNNACSLAGSITITNYLLMEPMVNTTAASPSILSIIICNLQAKKIIGIANSFIYVSNSSISTVGSVCVYTKIGLSWISAQIYNDLLDFNTTAIAQVPLTLFLAAGASVFIDNATSIISSIVAVLTKANITISNSNLNTSGKSCRTNGGNGRGAVVQYKNSFCTSGSSSCGYGSISSINCSNILLYFQFLSHSFPYMNKGSNLQGGSGGYGYVTSSATSGAGGGIIFLLAKQALILNGSQLLAEGGDAGSNQMISAGSGGTIYSYSGQLIGNGYSNLSTAGGASWNGNGSGSGGIIKISFASIQLEDPQSVYINITQGYQTNNSNLTPYTIFANGLFYGSTCNPGQQIDYLNCDPCPKGYYSILGDPICKKCPSAASMAINSSTGMSSIRQCLMEPRFLQLSRWFTPGSINILNISLYLLSLLLCSFIGILLRRKIKKEKLNLASDQFKLEDVRKSLEEVKILTEQFKIDRDVKCHELMYHTHRIVCSGFNTEDSPWVMPRVPPEEVMRDVLPQSFQTFADNFNRMARWSKGQYYLTKALTIIFYPCYWYYMDLVKKKKYRQLQRQLEEAREFNLINNYDCEDKDIITVKLSKNKDYTICYLDFFRYERADLRYFTLSSPFLMYLSGQGNFLRPFHLDDQDIFQQAMFFVVNRNVSSIPSTADQKTQLFGNLVSQQKRQENSTQLLQFIRKLNTITCTLDLSGSIGHFALTLDTLVTFLNEWNHRFFSKVAVQLDLILMLSRSPPILQVPTKAISLRDPPSLGKTTLRDEVHLLTKRDDSYFREFIEEKIQPLLLEERSSIKIGFFVYNPEQEIPNQQRERKLTAKSLEDDQSQNNESVLQQSLMSGHESAKKQPTWFRKFARIAHFIRYCLLSHKLTPYDEYNVKFVQSLLILTQTMLVFIWSIKIQIPYLFINLFAPFVGIVWFISDSYGFGKLYLIFNAMALVNQITTLIIYSLLDNKVDIFRTLLCQMVSIFLAFCISIVGCRAITCSKKLSLAKQVVQLKK